ncbi:MAG: poly-beta,6-N-acetyl-D-glucosamine synthase [Verrucomicrobiota bacterium]|jgi:glycosyltransferase involved in cell wall biosynthesis
MNKIRYVVITPVRDEEKSLPLTIASLAAQTVQPHKWIIVDDGSSDGTGAIAEGAAEKYSWIKFIRQGNRGFRAPGSGVIAAFNQGYRLVEQESWEFLVKLDGDLSFGTDYFEQCLLRFYGDANLGVGGGTICQRVNRQLVVEAPADPAFHVRGATKIYRRDCWHAIGGLIEAPGWDTVDEYKANMLGWTTYTFPELKLCHHRIAGGAAGTWKNWVKNGLANYVAGYHPLFMICKCGKRLSSKPYGIAALGLLAGFIDGYLHHVPQVDDRELIRYVRSQQLKRLLFRDSLWDRKPL